MKLKIKGNNFLVIGGGGFIGSHLVDQLAKQEAKNVVVYDNFSRGSYGNLREALKSDRVHVFEAGGDITQTDLLKKAMTDYDLDGVFHLAAVWLLQCQEYPRYAFNVNVAGTFNVMEACKEVGARLIYSSSASVYGSALTTPMTEEHPFNNETFYGATKIAGEVLLKAYAKRFMVDYTILRYMNVYGPRQDYKGAYVAVIMKMLDNIKQGLPPVIYGDGSQSFDFIYVGDVARANIYAMEAFVVDGAYNIGMGIPTTIKELTELILELTGSALKPEYKADPQSFVTQRLGSTEKALDHLGFKAKVGLREGMQNLIAWRERHEGINT